MVLLLPILVSFHPPLCDPSHFKFFSQILLFLCLIYVYPCSSCPSSPSMTSSRWHPNLCQSGLMVSRYPLLDPPPRHAWNLTHISAFSLHCHSMENCNTTWKNECSCTDCCFIFFCLPFPAKEWLPQRGDVNTV